MKLGYLISIFIAELLLLLLPLSSYKLNSAITQPKVSSPSSSYNYISSNIVNNDFVKNYPILKSYGPLILDINNLQQYSGIIFIPILNIDYKPLFLAINCNESIFNIKDTVNWKGWFKPFFTFELNILNDFCLK